MQAARRAFAPTTLFIMLRFGALSRGSAFCILDPVIRVTANTIIKTMSRNHQKLRITIIWGWNRLFSKKIDYAHYFSKMMKTMIGNEVFAEVDSKL